MPEIIPVGLCQCGCGERTWIATRSQRNGLRKGQPGTFKAGHHFKRREPRYTVNADTNCWEWNGAIDRYGYPGATWCNRCKISPCRQFWELRFGPLPKGYQLDHLCHTNDKTCIGGNSCRHRRCVNPEHLEPVTATENTRRGRVAKLNLSDVPRIRQSASEGYSRRLLSNKYPVSRTQIGRILAGHSWNDPNIAVKR